MKILIPSYNRAGNVSTYHKIDDSIIVVPESQYKDYVKHYDKSRLFVIPDKLDGNVARKRNAILDNYPDKEIFMIDDDLINVKEIKTGRKLNSIEFTRLIESGFDIINGLGLHFFGFNWSNQPLHNNPEIPFSFTKRFYAGVGIVIIGYNKQEKIKQHLDSTIIMYSARFIQAVKTKKAELP